jgi:hypothetical protein
VSRLAAGVGSGIALFSHTTDEVPGNEASGSSFAGGDLIARFRRLTACCCTQPRDAFDPLDAAGAEAAAPLLETDADAPDEEDGADDDDDADEPGLQSESALADAASAAGAASGAGGAALASGAAGSAAGAAGSAAGSAAGGALSLGAAAVASVVVVSIMLAI